MKQGLPGEHIDQSLLSNTLFLLQLPEPMLCNFRVTYGNILYG